MHGQRNATTDRELAVDGGQMLLHCFFADAEFAGDLTVAQSARDCIRHLALTVGQRLNEQGAIRGHDGFPLQEGAQLPPYFLKRGPLENRTPQRSPKTDPSATASLVLLE